MDTERLRAAFERLRYWRDFSTEGHTPSQDHHAEDVGTFLAAYTKLLPFAPLLEVVERLEASEAEWNVTLGRSRGKHTAEYEQSGVNGQWGHGSEMKAATWQKALAALASRLREQQPQ